MTEDDINPSYRIRAEMEGQAVRGAAFRAAATGCNASRATVDLRFHLCGSAFAIYLQG
ncbi:hypothetical protein [Pseudooceanicola onchidii]|uniref:hypothetical protein n=1 Tax=Pseudooceanicola onchidii TaxID=2562279 RepID=UPI00145A3AD9|nr:hypothetical protein [Pseudooceanicola onchidii]